MARNGRLAEDGIHLVTVEDDDQLIPTAAASYLAMKAAAASDGVALSIVEPAGAYRSAWVQNDMVDHPERYNLNPGSTITFGRSGQSHGWGDRIDINSAALPWMLANAARFGWTREYGAKDPNHFKHDGVTAVGGGTSGGGFTHHDTTTGVPMFTLFANNDDGAWYAQGITGRIRKLSTEEFEQMWRLREWMLGRVKDPNDNSAGIRRNAANIAIQARVLADINGVAGVVVPSAAEIAEAVEARLRDEHDELLRAIAAATTGDGSGGDDVAAVLLERLDALPARVREELGTALLATGR